MTYLFSTQNKESFQKQFIVQFLATYAAINYERQCLEGWSSFTFPVEDAEQLATDAWVKVVQTLGVKYE